MEAAHYETFASRLNVVWAKLQIACEKPKFQSPPKLPMLLDIESEEGEELSGAAFAFERFWEDTSACVVNREMTVLMKELVDFGNRADAAVAVAIAGDDIQPKLYVAWEGLIDIITKMMEKKRERGFLLRKV